MSRAAMRCADAEPYLSALADGEVAEPMRSAVTAHAATCQSCGEILARHRAVNGIVAALPASTPSPAVLDRVLAARASQTFEPVRRESMRRARQGLGLRRVAAFLTLPQPVPAPVLIAPRPRSYWQRTALPALVAALLIAFAFIAFDRVTPNLIGSQTTQTDTPTPQGDAYQQAQAAVHGAVAAHPVAFTAEIPWSLPSGATFKQARVDPATGALDIVWTLSDSLTQLHVREAPVALAQWSDYYSCALARSPWHGNCQARPHGIPAPQPATPPDSPSYRTTARSALQWTWLSAATSTQRKRTPPHKPRP